MNQHHDSSKPAPHALRLDVASIVQGGVAMLLAFTVAYLIIRPS